MVIFAVRVGRARPPVVNSLSIFAFQPHPVGSFSLGAPVLDLVSLEKVDFSTSLFNFFGRRAIFEWPTTEERKRRLEREAHSEDEKRKIYFFKTETNRTLKFSHHHQAFPGRKKSTDRS